MSEPRERLSMREQLERLFGKPASESSSGAKSVGKSAPRHQSDAQRRSAPSRGPQSSVAHALRPVEVVQSKALTPSPAMAADRKPVPVIDRTAAKIITGDAALNLVRDKLQGMTFHGATPPPTSVAEAEESAVRSIVTRGGHILIERAEPDETGYLVGFDFGTSSSKVVIHQPGAQDLAYALPVPEPLRVEERGRRQDHLWRTVVWFNPQTQSFSLLPLAGHRPIEGFKTKLIQSDGDARLGPVSAMEAATAYLAMLCAFTIGHHALYAPRGFKRDQHYSRFHLGAPVSSLEEADCVSAFRVCLNAAMQLAPRASALDLVSVQQAVATAGNASEVTGATPCLLFEELAAVVAGYRASSDHRRGPHLIVDVGASTLDIATFSILDEQSPVPVFYSSVELLGSDSYAVARALEVSSDQFGKACQAQCEQVLYTTWTRRDPQFRSKNGIPKPLIFIGGGRLNRFYEDIFQRYTTALESHTRTPQPGNNLTFDPSTDFARLLVAWGLSQEDIRLPRIKAPSEIEDFSPVPSSGTAGFVSKDMC